jgi:hypothetical protein
VNRTGFEHQLFDGINTVVFFIWNFSGNLSYYSCGMLLINCSQINNL